MARVSRLHREGVGSIPTESTVAVAYWFADKNVALIDAGSIPVSHPILSKYSLMVKFLSSKQWMSVRF